MKSEFNKLLIECINSIKNGELIKKTPSHFDEEEVEILESLKEISKNINLISEQGKEISLGEVFGKIKKFQKKEIVKFGGYQSEEKSTKNLNNDLISPYQNNTHEDPNESETLNHFSSKLHYLTFKFNLLTTSLNSTLIIAETDAQGRITFANKKFLELSKFSQEELIGQDHRIINSGHHSKEFMKNLWETIQKGNTWEGDFKNKAKDGSFYWVHTYIFPAFNKKGEIIKYLSLRYEITKQKITEDNAILFAKAKSEFLARMSHELRTPLNGILGCSHILSGYDLKREEKELINIIIYSGEILKDTINKILDFSKLQNKKMFKNNSFISIKELLRNIFNIVKSSDIKKNNKITLEIDEYVPDRFFSDVTFLEMIFINLLSNSYKFTSSGEIKVKVGLKSKKKSDITLIFSVIDNGIGIKKEYLSKIFESFSQEDETLARRYEGTGLGLSIAKELVKLLGGEIYIESEKDIGTKVTFTIKANETF